MLDQQVLEEIYTIAEKVGAHQVLTEREQAMYDDILEDAGYYQAFCLYTAMIDFPTFGAGRTAASSAVRSGFEKCALNTSSISSDVCLPPAP